MHFSIFTRARWAVNRFLVRNTPKYILDKFRKGLYQDFLSDGQRKPHHLSWPHTRRLINRCLDCGFYVKSVQDLNVDPLGQTYLEVYEFVKSL